MRSRKEGGKEEGDGDLGALKEQTGSQTVTELI